MKQLTIIGIFILFWQISSVLKAVEAINQFHPVYSQSAYQQTSLEEEEILDSIVTYDYINSADSFPQRKSSYVYNTEGVSLVKTDSRWNYNVNLHYFVWENEKKYLYGTDTMGNDTLFMMYEWSEGSNRWKEYDKKVRTFTDAGALKIELDQYWDPDSGAWLVGGYTEITYDENGNLIEYQHRTRRSASDYKITPHFKIVYTYNELNLKISSTQYFWDTDIEDFYKSDSTAIFYNEDLRDTLNLVYNTWINYSGWENDERILKEYDPAGNETSLITQVWNDLTHEYENSEKTAHEYNEQNQITSETSYTWVKSKQDWQGYTLFTYEYDDNGNVVLEQIANWSKELTDWENVYTFVYDYDGQLLLSKSTAYDDFFDKDFYYYQGMSLVGLPEINGSELVLYPVPATNTLYFSGVEQVKSVRIYTTDGKLVRSLGAMYGESAIKLDGLNSGLYLFEITLGNHKRLVRKISIK